jgi:type I restriction enzyme S subunit
MSVTMNDSLVLRESIERRLESALRPNQHLLVKKGDIAYNMMRMWQGACGLALQDGIVSPAYVVLEPKPTIDSRFAYHWFKSARMIHLFWAYSHGVADDRLRLYFDSFSEVPVAPPPLEKQHSIANVLDAWDESISEIERLIAAKRRWKAGMIGRILLSSGGKAGYIRDLGRVNPRNPRIANEALVSFVRMQDVSEHGELLTYAEKRRGDLGTGYTQFIDGDILVAKITPCFENGKGALASGLSNGIGFGTTEFHVIRPHDVADAEYLLQITLTPGFRTAGERQMTGSAGQKRVPAEFIEDFPILISDRKARQNVGQYLAAVDSELSILEKTLSARRAQKRSLVQKLLAEHWSLRKRFELSDVMSASSVIGIKRKREFRKVNVP